MIATPPPPTLYLIFSGRRHLVDQSCESDRELCCTWESLGSLGNCLLFLALASDLDRGDLDLENDLEDLDRSFHTFFEEDLKVLLDREHE